MLLNQVTNQDPVFQLCDPCVNESIAEPNRPISESEHKSPLDSGHVTYAEN